MSLRRRHAALGVGGAVISATLLLALERCAGPAPGSGSGVQHSAASETGPMRFPLAAAPRLPDAIAPARAPAARPWVPPLRPLAPHHALRDPAKPKSLDLTHLLDGLQERQRPPLVAANDEPVVVAPAATASLGVTHRLSATLEQTTTAPGPPAPPAAAVPAELAVPAPAANTANPAVALDDVPAQALATEVRTDQVAQQPAAVPEPAGPALAAEPPPDHAHTGTPVGATAEVPGSASMETQSAGSPAQAETGPFQQLAATVQPREPLLGLAGGPGRPAAAPVAVPDITANDNPAPASAPAPSSQLSPAPSPAVATSAAPPDAALKARPASPAAANTAPASFSDDNELILEIMTARGERDDTIIAYNTRGIVYLPLGAIARFLDLAVTVSDDGRYAAGWVLDPARTIALNLREGSLDVAGRHLALSPGDGVAFDGEMYVRAERFADLFPLTLTPNLRSQTVLVKTSTPFPFEQAAERETARERLKGQTSRPVRTLPRVSTPWRAADVPMVDSELRLASDSVRGTRGEFDLRVAGDLAWLTAKTFVSVDSRLGPTVARLEMGRRDPDATLLGPLKATEFGFGDVTSAPLAMGPAGTIGRGFFIANTALERASVFDRIELHGDMPAGYEAELYRNDLLIDTLSTPQDGQYRFLNIPVEFGLNVFRVVLYGPQGQRREIVRQISVGDGRLGAGELSYSVAAIQKNRPLFNLRNDAAAPGPDDGSVRIGAQVQYGLTAGLTATVGTAMYERLGQRHWLSTAGIRSGFAGFAVRMDLGLADQHGRALSLGLARKLGGFQITANHAEYSGNFADEVRSFSDQDLRRVTEFTLNGVVRIGSGAGGLHIPLSGIARDITFADGRRTQSASLNQTISLARDLQLANLIEFNRTSAPLFGSTSQLRGALDLSTFSSRSLQLRASLGYALAPHAQLQSATVEIDRGIGDRGAVSLSAGRNFVAAQNHFGMSAIHRFDKFSLSLDGSYTSNPGQYAALLRLSFSLGRDPLNARMFTAPTGMASGGAVAVRAFRDLNGNGIFDSGEPPVPEVRFFTGSESAITGTNGTALLGRLGDGPRTSVRVDGDTLPDISFAPEVEGIEIVPRAGRIHAQDFAIEALGSIDGTARFRGTGGADQPVSGVIVLLLDEQGHQASRTRTGSDGSFWFEKLRPGQYRLSLDDAQAGRLNIRMVDAGPVVVGQDGDAARQDLQLTRR